MLAEKPLISEETDLIEPTLLDELICHIASLASVYHKPPNAFVEGRTGFRRVLPAKSQSYVIYLINLAISLHEFHKFYLMMKQERRNLLFVLLFNTLLFSKEIIL